MHSAYNALLIAAGVVFLGSAAAKAQPAPPTEAPAPTPPGTEAPAAGEKPAPRPAKEAPSGQAPTRSAAEPPTQPEAAPEPGASETHAAQPPPAPANPLPPAEAAPTDNDAEPPGAELPATEQGPPAGVTAPLLPQASARPDAERDLSALMQQGDERPTPQPQEVPAGGDRTYAEQWWSHARPILELHGYFRLRAELFHKLALNRRDPPGEGLWPQPLDNVYVGSENSYNSSELCTPDEAGVGSNDDPGGTLVPCRNNSQAGANLRFRLNPELHISDNLRILSQIDILDNLVLGSTPSGSANEPSGEGGYSVVARSSYVPLGYYDDTQVPPSAGINGFKDSVRIKRVWGEYETPVGELRFGRMPDHWGLGMLHNGGDDYDADYQSTVDRILFVTAPRLLPFYLGFAWDFPNEGYTSEYLALPQGQAYDLAQLDDVDQWALILARKRDAELVAMDLAKGKLVVNAGVYLTYRKQLLANDNSGECDTSPNAAALGCSPTDMGSVSQGYVRRGAEAWTPDLWLELLYKKFRFEAEAVTVQGSVDSTSVTGSNYATAPGGEGWKISQWGVASELEQKLVEDRLRLTFNFGWASGDPDAATGAAGLGLSPGLTGLQEQLGDNTFSTFRFHPNHRVDLILHRRLLTRVQGTYYFRPGVAYDFMRDTEGQKLGGGFAAIWSRASEFMQTPGHGRDLGIELNGRLYFQGKDGALNDDLNRLGGFYTMLEYGVLFPLNGLSYQPRETELLASRLGKKVDTEIAHTLRWYLGISF
jgi:uncharacterized protein (TIGR04551 family)